MNSGVYIKGSCYNDFNRDFYGVLVDIIELEYLGVGNKLVLLSVVGLTLEEVFKYTLVMVW